MKNVTKILTAVTLCAALFASDQRIAALGGNAAFWPGDDANIAAFPAQMNNHSFVQLTGVGADGDQSAGILWNDGGTTWGFDYSNSNHDWFDVSWGNGDMGVNIGMVNWSDGADVDEQTRTGHRLGWGKAFSFGELGVTMTGTAWKTNANCDCSGEDATVDCDAADGATDCATNGGSHTAAADTDASTMNLNLSRACDFWAFDTMVAGYSSSCSGEDCDSVTNISVDMVSHMNAGAADVVWAMGLDMDDDGTDDGASNSMKSTLAVEANMTDWATLRAGATYVYNLSADSDATGNAFDWNWGLGFNWGDFTADYTINDNIFQDPISTITGYDAGDLTSESVTFTYSF